MAHDGLWNTDIASSPHGPNADICTTSRPCFTKCTLQNEDASSSGRLYFVVAHVITCGLSLQIELLWYFSVLRLATAHQSMVKYLAAGEEPSSADLST